MLRTFPISNIKNDGFLSQIDENNKVIAFTKNGKPKYAVLDWKLYEEISETVEVLADAPLLEAIKRGINDLQNNNIASLEDVENELL